MKYTYPQPHKVLNLGIRCFLVFPRSLDASYFCCVLEMRIPLMNKIPEY